MNPPSLKEAALLPINLAGFAVVAFALFRACYGERVPFIGSIILASNLATGWIIRTTELVETKPAISAVALGFLNCCVVAILVLNGFGAR